MDGSEELKVPVCNSHTHCFFELLTLYLTSLPTAKPRPQSNHDEQGNTATTQNQRLAAQDAQLHDMQRQLNAMEGLNAATQSALLQLQAARAPATPPLAADSPETSKSN
jgi:hypothetical protein